MLRIGLERRNRGRRVAGIEHNTTENDNTEHSHNLRKGRNKTKMTRKNVKEKQINLAMCIEASSDAVSTDLMRVCVCV